MAASAAAALAIKKTENTSPAASTAASNFKFEQYCLAHSSWEKKGQKNKACAFCGIRKKKHTAPLLVPEEAVPEFLEVSTSCEDASSCDNRYVDISLTPNTHTNL